MYSYQLVSSQMGLSFASPNWHPPRCLLERKVSSIHFSVEIMLSWSKDAPRSFCSSGTVTCYENRMVVEFKRTLWQQDSACICGGCNVYCLIWVSLSRKPLAQSHHVFSQWAGIYKTPWSSWCSNPMMSQGPTAKGTPRVEDLGLFWNHLIQEFLKKSLSSNHSF